MGVWSGEWGGGEERGGVLVLQLRSDLLSKVEERGGDVDIDGVVRLGDGGRLADYGPDVIGSVVDAALVEGYREKGLARSSQQPFLFR